ncbi:MAG: translation initiation factor IF-2, partial [Verrucomicrobiota bacterium]
MSVRIYQLSKEIGVENTELLDLLRERGFAVKSASSTIDNISAESIIDEFKAKQAEADAPAEEADSQEMKEEKVPVQAPSVAAFVKTPDQIEAEKKAAEEAKKKEEQASAAAAQAPAALTPVPAPKTAAPPPLAAPPKAAPPVAAPPKAAPPVASPPKVASPKPSPVAPPVGVKPAPVAASVPVAPPASAPAPAAPAPAVPKPAGPPAPPSPVAKGPAPAAPATPPSGDAKEGSGGIRTITVKPPIVVRDLANELGIKPFKLISELMEEGIFASINQSLEEEVAVRLAEKHGVILEVRHRGEGNQNKKKKVEKKVDETELMEERPPVVAIMGHVDHGKTTLLDSIRKANVVSGEAGGITQHIGAYQVSHNDKKITFLDTPGHAAFNQMRERGAGVTDVAVLIVAADDGFMPQTDEALKFIQKAGVSPIVAINKIDAPGANLDKVKQQMQQKGIAPEEWGGETICVEVSALKGEGIEDLLEMILLQAEVLELQANPKKPSEGIIIEAEVEVGRGPTATVIVQAGTMKVGDALVCGSNYTKVKAMFNEHGDRLKSAPPSTPVRVIGWSGTPSCGALFHSVKNEKAAKREAEEILIKEKAEAQQANEAAVPNSAEALFAAIAKSQAKTLRLILKGDVFGSVEAVVGSLEAIESDKVELEVIDSGVGAINLRDVQKASAAGAQIVGFNVKNENGVVAAAKREEVKIVHHQIIYELLDQVRDE